MKKLLLTILILVAIVMISLGIKAKIAPPVLTGVGFIIISILLYRKE
jgi:hypothetical protein